MSDVISRRLFKNADGDWKKVEALTREILKESENVQKHAELMVTAYQRVGRLVLEAYKIVPKTDALYLDSPLSPHRQSAFLKQFLKKLGLDGFSRDVVTPDILIMPFIKQMRDGCRWLLKFKEDDQET